MPNVIIIHHEPRVYRAEGLTFMPGVNQIDEAALRRAGRNKLLRDRFRRRVLTTADGGSFDFDAVPDPVPAPPAPIGGQPGNTGTGGDQDYPLAKLNAAKAIELVEQTVDRDLLARWQEAEGRKTVKEAIEKQLAAVQPGNTGTGGDQ